MTGAAGASAPAACSVLTPVMPAVADVYLLLRNDPFKLP